MPTHADHMHELISVYSHAGLRTITIISAAVGGIKFNYAIGYIEDDCAQLKCMHFTVPGISYELVCGTELYETQLSNTIISYVDADRIKAGCSLVPEPIYAAAGGLNHISGCPRD